MERQASWAANSEMAENFLWLQSETEAFSGKMGKARGLNRLAAEMALGKSKGPSAGLYEVTLAVAEAEVGNLKPTVNRVTKALELNPPPDFQAMAAIALARAGDSSGAEKLIDKLKKQFPLNTMVGYGLQTASAATELNRNRPEKALELLEPTARYEYSGNWNLYAVYIRGLANLQLHRGAGWVA